MSALKTAEIALREAGELIALAQKAMRRIGDEECADLAASLDDRRESVTAISKSMKRRRKAAQ